MFRKKEPEDHFNDWGFVSACGEPEPRRRHAYNLVVLGLNRGSPSEEKTSMKKNFFHSLMGHCFRLVVIPINMKLCPCIIPINIFQLQSL